jgi:CO/xanthine dehydrogenase Mo-binding subunit
MAPITRRAFLGAGGALVVGLALDGRTPRRTAGQVAPAPAPTAWPTDRYLGKTVAPDQVDAFLAIHADNTITVFTGKVDLGTGGRAAMRQMVAEELDVAIERITELIEADTAVCPDQGGTGGSTGISRGGQELRRAGATARQALLALAAQRLGRPVADLEVADGVVSPKGGGPSVTYGELIGDRQLGLKIDAKAPLKPPGSFRYIGQSVPRPDVPAKVTGRHLYAQNLKVPGMLHGRAIRPPALGATLQSVDESSIAAVPGARVVRIGGFLGIVAEREWDAVRAARLLKAQWSPGTGLPDYLTLADAVRATRIVRDQDIAKQGDLAPLGAPGPGVQTLGASYWWPVQTHGSLGPSCGVVDVRPDGATIWTPSQATHRYREGFARILGLPPEKVRLIYLDGAGSYGQNGAEDAACDAALLSRAVGRPVRVQWMREDEHGWDPKGPPQLLDLRAAVGEGGDVVAWETQAWFPLSTQGLPNLPLLAPIEAGLAQPLGRATGLLSQNIDPPYRVGAVHAVVHWLDDSPFRTSAIRAPEQLRGGVVRGRGVRAREGGSGRVPVSPPRGPTRAGSAATGGRADGLAVATLAAAAGPGRRRAHGARDRLRPLQAQ